MKRFNTILALSLSLFALTACGEETKTVTDAAKDGAGAATDIAKGTAGAAADAAKDTAVKAADTAKNAADTAKNAADTAKNAAGTAAEMAGKAMGMKDGVMGMKDGIAAAQTAIKAGDFQAAQTEVTKLKESWGKISETVEKQSGVSYKTINDGLANVETSLKDAKPDKDKVVSQLQSLTTTVTGLVASK
jgi:uncharacterized phage infection (PIP) family protein YhgE